MKSLGRFFAQKIQASTTSCSKSAALEDSYVYADKYSLKKFNTFWRGKDNVHTIAICVHRKINPLSTSLCFKRTVSVEDLEQKQADTGMTGVVPG